MKETSCSQDRPTPADRKIQPGRVYSVTPQLNLAATVTCALLADARRRQGANLRFLYTLFAIVVALASMSALDCRPASAVPAIQVSGGLSPGGFHPVRLFTWTMDLPVTGTGWSPGESVNIVLHGPLNTLGVAPADRTIGTLIADGGGGLTSVPGNPNIPYDAGGPGTIPRPGHYEVHGVGAISGNVTSAQQIDICPATFIADPFGIDWSHERGGRSGLLGSFSPERVDPHWMSVWEERPVGVYGTISATDGNGNNQPSFVTHSDYPPDHFGHDWNWMLVPDPAYQWLMGTANYNKIEDDQASREIGRMEVEWESLNDGHPSREAEQGNIGAPSWVSPGAGDRVYIVGRWILDAGHPEVGDRCEIHNPRLLATLRSRNTVMPLSDALPDCMTRASQVDIYVSGHGGGSNRNIDGLGAALDAAALGNGGGRIRDALPNLADQEIYYQPGPMTAGTFAALVVMAAAVALLPIPEAGLFGAVAAFTLGVEIKFDAGPRFFWGDVRGPENRPINDMNYEFDVPLPRAPAGATTPQWKVATHPGHTTAVEAQITPTDPDPVTGLPRKAHILLPYLGADNGIYAATIKFGWDAYNPPGRHFLVEMDNIQINDDSDFDLPGTKGGILDFLTGEWHLWTEVCGQWVYLTGLNPDPFLDANDGDTIGGLGAAKFDVYLDSTDSLRVFTGGYEEDTWDDLFGNHFDDSPYDGGIAIALALIPPQSGDNDQVGGALFEKPSVPKEAVVGSYDIPAASVDGTVFYNMRFRVTYIPSPPRIELNGVPANFGNVCLGASEDRVIEIFNVGEQPLDVNSITVTGAGLARLPSPNVPFTVAGGAHVDITVRFSPTDITQGAGSIAIDSTDPCQPHIMFDLSGKVIYPVAKLAGSLSFGSLPVDDRSVGSTKVLGFDINNIGGCPLRIDSVVVAPGSDPDFAVLTPPTFPAFIEPGGTLTVPVLFNPSTTGTRNATLNVVAGNDPTHLLPLTIAAQGVGLSPVISATPASTIFAPTVVGCQRTQLVHVFNTGPAELIIDSATIAGAGFSVDPVNLPIRLAPNGSTDLTVRFTVPAVQRRYDGTLTLASNDLTTPSKVVTFCGEGTPIGIRVLVKQANGTPYASVDSINLTSYGITPNTNVNLKDVPLKTINPPTSCSVIQYHYETALPASTTSGKRGSSYSLKVKVGAKAQTVSFTLDVCDFKEIVITLQ